MSVEMVAGDGRAVAIPLFASPQRIRVLRLTLGSARVEISAPEDEAGLTSLNVVLTDAGGCRSHGGHAFPTDAGVTIPILGATAAQEEAVHRGRASPHSQITITSPATTPPPDDNGLELQVPAHGGSDAVGGAGVAEENPLPPSADESGGHYDSALEEWLKEMRGTAMVVALLIASITFQAGLSPPGGSWQDTQLSPGGRPGTNHTAGEPIMRDVSPHMYTIFRFANSAAFAQCVAIIMLLTRESTFRLRFAAYTLRLLLNGAVMALAVAYIFAFSSKHEAEGAAVSALSQFLTYVLCIGAAMWKGWIEPLPRGGYDPRRWLVYAARLLAAFIIPVMPDLSIFAQNPSVVSNVLLTATIVWSVPDRG